MLMFVLCVAAVGLAGQILLLDFPDEVTPWSVLNIGWHAATMFILVSASFLVRAQGYPRSGQSLAIAGMAPPLLSMVGYAYGIDQFHGAMSPITTAIGIVFAATPFMLGARTGFMRALASPWNGGRYGRLQIASVGGLLFVGGLLLQMGSVNFSSYLAAYVVGSILVLTLISGYSAIAIERSDYARRAAERVIAQLVLHDPLTGLFNRRFLKEQAGGIVAFAQRQGIPLSLLIMDFDHFKTINDEFGHQVGDIVLQRVSHLLKTRLRRGDVAVRYGGEELLVVLPGASETDAVEIAETLRRTVAQMDVSDIGPDSVTVSIGVADVKSTLHDAVAIADARLYMAKKAGRDCVVGQAGLYRPQVRLAVA
jgi:diguanylate cyclase (GGDEF)-like protein